jgi:hypothetical protein
MDKVNPRLEQKIDELWDKYAHDGYPTYMSYNEFRQCLIDVCERCGLFTPVSDGN